MFGDLGKIMKVVGELKTKLPEMKEKLAAARFSADAGEGTVTATVSGKLELTDLKISESLLEDKDPAMLEDVIKAAVSAAQADAATAAAAEMKEITGGMDIPGLSGLL
ncbi:MAG: YbaB/EbfC family nucleoid-associated protein [Phycisphaerae bacterium]|nr:YbaB/EbfC family nucleoid-associated protein [Phycisphaerae bacterium]